MIRIIVVEDDPVVAQLNAAYLSRMEDCQVIGTYANGREALACLQRTPVDLAVLDVHMPVCTGLELRRQMRSGGIRTAAFMLTAATEMTVVEEALRLGIEDYIIKPFSYDRLREAVLRFRDRARLVRTNRNASQDVVDQLLGNQPVKPQAQKLPKGLNHRTLETIRRMVEESADGAHTCESISSVSGLSRVTVRHYLNYLSDAGVLTSAIDYETGGRPRVLYRLK